MTRFVYDIAHYIYQKQNRSLKFLMKTTYVMRSLLRVGLCGYIFGMGAYLPFRNQDMLSFRTDTRVPLGVRTERTVINNGAR